MRIAFFSTHRFDRQRSEEASRTHGREGNFALDGLLGFDMRGRTVSGACIICRSKICILHTRGAGGNQITLKNVAGVRAGRHTGNELQ